MITTGWIDVYTMIALIGLLVVLRLMGPRDWKTDAWCAAGVVLWPLALAWLVWSWLRPRDD